MACGKSTVASIWGQLGARIIDSDATVHRLLREDEDVLRHVRHAFGDGVFTADGAIDRPGLGRVVFGDEDARQRLMGILHPKTLAIHRSEAEQHGAAHPTGVAVIDSPLLFESGLDADMDVTVTVAASEETRIRRAAARLRERGVVVDEAELRRRDAMQMSVDEKRDRADIVIENDGSEAALKARALSVWDELRGMAEAT
jgi:dephospho-CoA kinase